MILENNNLRKKLTDGSFEGLCQNSDDFKKLEQAKTINEARKILAKYGYVENLETFRKEIIDLILENEETLQTVSGGRGKKPVAASSVLAMLAGLNLHLPVKATLGEKLLDLEIAHSMKENNDKLNNANNSPAKILTILGTMVLTPVLGGGLKYAINIAGENRLIKDICENRLVKDDGNWVRLEEKVKASTDVQSINPNVTSLISARNMKVGYQKQILGVLNGLLEDNDALNNAENLTWICNLLVADWKCIIEWLGKDEVLTKDQQISIAATLVTLIKVLGGTVAYDSKPGAGVEGITREILKCSTTTDCRKKLTAVATDWMKILQYENKPSAEIDTLLKTIQSTLNNSCANQYNSGNQDQSTDEQQKKDDIIKLNSVNIPDYMEKEAESIEEDKKEEEEEEEEDIEYNTEDDDDEESQNNYPEQKMNYDEAVAYLKKIEYLSDADPLKDDRGPLLWTIGGDYADLSGYNNNFTLQDHIESYNAELESGKIVYKGDEALVFIELVNTENGENDDEIL